MPKENQKSDPINQLFQQSAFDPPVRNVVRRTTRRVVGQHYSRKMAGLIGWESQIEHKCLQMYEVDPEIIRFQTQPHTFKVNGKRYTPDVAVVGRNAEYYVEVKPDWILEDEEAMETISLLQQHFHNAGTELRLVTESQLLTYPMRSNVERLLRITRRRFDMRLIEALVRRCSGEMISIEELNKRMQLPENSDLVLEAVVLGFLALDISRPINGTSLVTPYEGDFS